MNALSGTMRERTAINDGDGDEDDGAVILEEEEEYFGGVDAQWFGASERGTATLEHFEAALSVVVGHHRLEVAQQNHAESV